MKVELTGLEVMAMFAIVLDRHREAFKSPGATTEWVDVVSNETVTTESLLALLAKAKVQESES